MHLRFISNRIKLQMKHEGFMDDLLRKLSQDLLGDDLEMPTGQGLILMSDQHKGLIEVVNEVMPYAEHRQCARHIYEEFRKLYSGVEFRVLFWDALKATYPGSFSKIIEKIKRANPNAYDYQFGMRVKTTVKRGGSAQFGVQRGRRVETSVKRGGAGYRRGSIPFRRFSNLGRWFGLGENDYEFDPVKNSEMAQETNQNAANDSFAATQETYQFSATAFASTQNSQNH
ncbi:pentatricopeptide repeat-containing protein [Tanacetum coccineum]